MYDIRGCVLDASSFFLSHLTLDLVFSVKMIMFASILTNFE